MEVGRKIPIKISFHFFDWNIIDAINRDEFFHPYLIICIS